MEGTIDAIWETLRERFGTDLRAVIYYDGDVYDTRMRDDVQESLFPDGDRAIVEDVIYDKLDAAHQERLFGAGEFACEVRVFEDAYVIHHQLPNERGTIIGLDRGADLPTITAIKESLDTLSTSPSGS